MKLHIEETKIGDVYHCRICLAEDEDAYNSGEVVVIGESTFEATVGSAYGKARSQAQSNIGVLISFLNAKHSGTL